MENLTKLNRRRWVVQLALITGLALLFLAALLWGLQGVTPACADPGTLYVDGTSGSDDSDCSNPAAPCATIGYALNQATNDDEILVAEGTYAETLDIVITVTLKGGYTVSGTVWLPHTGGTVIDANGADHSVIQIYPNANVTVEGFTLQGANHTSDAGGGFLIDRATVVVSGTVIQDNTTGHSGGGIDVQGGTLALVNSSLLNNTASGDGGGLTAHSWDIITLDNVTVQGNTAQGWGGGLNTPRITITNSRIASNTAVDRGGGVVANVATIYNSEISDNEVTEADSSIGGGISVGASGAGRLVIWDSTVSGNRAVGAVESLSGGIDAEGAEATIVNTTVSNNYAQYRAGISVYGAVLTMTNSLIISNAGNGLGGQYVTGTIINVTVADNTGPGVSVSGAVSITNSIMWGNGATDYSCTGSCTLAYSDVGNGDTTGSGNISEDPLFVDAANGNYHLYVGSPCIDKGTSAGAPATDIEGTPRDAAPDMGAYEWTGFRLFLPLALKNLGP